MNKAQMFEFVQAYSNSLYHIDTPESRKEPMHESLLSDEQYVQVCAVLCWPAPCRRAPTVGIAAA